MFRFGQRSQVGSGRTDLVEMSQMVFFGGQLGFSGFKLVQEDWLNLSRATLGEVE